MTSEKSSVVICCMAVLALAGTRHVRAEPLPSSEAGAYCQLHLENKPEGVYEWDDRDLLFVLVRIPRKDIKRPEQLESAELSATRRTLHNWLKDRAAVKRVDDCLPMGMDRVRKLCRKILPYHEYTSEWRFDGESCAFTSEEDTEHVCTTVFRKSDVLASLPAAYLNPVSESVWYDGLEKIVRRCYLRETDRTFVSDLGALDCLDAMRKSNAAFPSWDADDFAGGLNVFLDESADTWRDAVSPAKEEYASVWRSMQEYLSASDVAKGFRRDALSVIHPPSRTVVSSEPARSVSAPFEFTSTATNSVAGMNPVTNRTVGVGSDLRVLPLMSMGDRVDVETVRTDDSIITTVHTQMVVTVTRTLVRKTVSTYRGEPRFEMLFLGAGCIANEKTERLPSGVAAEKAFYGRVSNSERERLLLSALRENPGDKVLWNLYGRFCQTRNDLLGALICFRNSLRIDPEYEFAITNIANVYSDMGMRNLAVGMAAIARGVAVDAWCRSHAEAILHKEWQTE